MRVDESSNSRLALNSHALSATLAVSRPLLPNLILLKFLLRVAESFLSFGPRLSCHVMNSRQLSFLFGRGNDSHRELEKTLVQVSSFKLSVSSVGPDFQVLLHRMQFIFSKV